MSDKRLLIKAVLFSSVCGLLASVIFMCVLAAVMLSSGVIPSDILNYCSAAIAGIASLIAGITAARITKCNGLVTGALTGLCIFIVITITALTTDSGPVSALTLIKLILCVLGGGIGGVIGVNKKEKINIK